MKSTNKGLLTVLETENQLIQSLQLDFVNMLRESGNLKVTCFYEELPLPMVGHVVCKESATLDGYNSIGIHANHSAMVKFASKEDNRYKSLLGELQRWMNEKSYWKKVLIVGGGASAIEALEFAVKNGAAEIDVLSRSDKWIIPRNILVQSLLACNIFGQETSLSWIPEWLLRKFFYRDLQDIAPLDKGIFTGTPMANDELFNQIREGKAHWLRGDICLFGLTWRISLEC